MSHPLRICQADSPFARRPLPENTEMAFRSLKVDGRLVSSWVLVTENSISSAIVLHVLSVKLSS